MIKTPDPLPVVPDASAGRAGSEIILKNQVRGGVVTSKDDRPATYDRHRFANRSWERRGAKWQWDGANLRMRTLVSDVIEAIVIEPYPHMRPGHTAAAWARHLPPTPERRSMKNIALAKAFLALDPEQQKQAVAAIEASQDPNHPLTKVMKGFSPERFRMAMASITPEYRTAVTAQQILATAAKVRGETYDPKSAVPGPVQSRVQATADDILKAGRQRRGEK